MDENGAAGEGVRVSVSCCQLFCLITRITHTKNIERNKLGICTEITLCKLSHKPTADGRVGDNVYKY